MHKSYREEDAGEERANERYQKKVPLNHDLDAEGSGGFSQYNSSNGGATKLLTSSFRNPEEKDKRARRIIEQAEQRHAKPQYNNDDNHDQEEGRNSLENARRPLASKPGSVTKETISRTSIRKSSKSFGKTQKAAPISIAMQVLNMDEDEKE